MVQEKAITKPTQMGAFILGYSRRKMLKYFKATNKYFDIKDSPQNSSKQVAQDMYYTDTDSITVHGRNIVEMGKELGEISNDLGLGTKIIRGIWIAPKLYLLTYVDRDCEQPLTEREEVMLKERELKVVIGKDSIPRKVKFHLRGKGVSKGFYRDGEDAWVSNLNEDTFEKMLRGEEHNTSRAFRIKMIGVHRNSKQQMYEAFNIIHEEEAETTRTLNKRKWAGRVFIKDGSVPIGHLADARG
jgi:hypothetical protein